jgi:hypothetical protein
MRLEEETPDRFLTEMRRGKGMGYPEGMTSTPGIADCAILAEPRSWVLFCLFRLFPFIRSGPSPLRVQINVEPEGCSSHRVLARDATCATSQHSRKARNLLHLHL